MRCLPVPVGGTGPVKLPSHGFTYLVGFGDATALPLMLTVAELDTKMLDEALPGNALTEADEAGVLEALFVELPLLVKLLVEFWMLRLNKELELGLELLELTVSVSRFSSCMESIGLTSLR
jgi:hypothetical protein